MHTVEALPTPELFRLPLDTQLNTIMLKICLHDMLKNILNLTTIFEIINLASNRSPVELSVIYFPSNWVSITVLTT